MDKERGEFHQFSQFLTTFPHLTGSLSTAVSDHHPLFPSTSSDWSLPPPPSSRGVFSNEKITAAGLCSSSVTNVDHGFRPLEDVGGVDQTNGVGMTNALLPNFLEQSGRVGGPYDASRSEHVRNPYTLQSFFCENARSSSSTVPGDMAIGRKQSCIELDCFSLKESNNPGFPIKAQEDENLAVVGSQKISTSSSSSAALVEKPLELFHGEVSTENYNINRQLGTTWIQTYDCDYDSSVVLDTTMFPTRKRKYVPIQNHVGRSGWNFMPYGLNTNLSQMVIDPVLQLWQQRLLETSQFHEKISPLPTSGNQILPSNTVCVDTDDKELERLGLIVVLKKELRRSDVSSLGRIVLPKKQAEAYLPYLTQKEGIQLQMRDFTYSGVWTFKYRYWPNNKSRMYIMENTGDFIRIHGLKTGDFFTVYIEQSSGTFIVRGKKHDGGRLLPAVAGSQSEGNENSVHGNRQEDHQHI